MKRTITKIILIFSACVFVLGVVLTAVGAVNGGVGHSYHYEYDNRNGGHGYYDDRYDDFFDGYGMEDDIERFFDEFEDYYDNDSHEHGGNI